MKLKTTQVSEKSSGYQVIEESIEELENNRAKLVQNFVAFKSGNILTVSQTNMKKLEKILNSNVDSVSVSVKQILKNEKVSDDLAKVDLQGLVEYKLGEGAFDFA